MGVAAFPGPIGVTGSPTGALCNLFSELVHRMLTGLATSAVCKAQVSEPASRSGELYWYWEEGTLCCTLSAEGRRKCCSAPAPQKYEETKH